MPISTQSLRSIAFLGQSGSGKTALVEALLGSAGIKLQQEARRNPSGNGHSLSASIFHLDYRDTRSYLIDTPGLPDFIGQTISVLPAADTAAIVIDAATGVEMMTQRMMELARQQRMCRLIIVNKIDLPDLDLPGLVGRIQQAFGRECLPLNLPRKHAAEVADCFFSPDGESDFSTVAAAHAALMDQVVEVDPAFMETYLEQGDIDPAILHAPFEQALREGHLVPICFTSAQTGVGLSQLIDVLVRLMPNPTEGNPPSLVREEAGDPPRRTAVKVEADASQHVLAHVFKVAMDPYVGRLCAFRVLQGTVRRDSTLYIGDKRKPFRVSHLYRLQGREQEEIPQGLPGEICAVSRVDDITWDAILHDAPEDASIHLQSLPLPQAVYGLSIEATKRGDEQRLWDTLQKLCAEDPCLQVERSAGTGETVISGTSELHLRSVLERMSDLYKAEVIVHAPKLAFRETVAGSAEGHHRHKKQSGGAGQFGEVFLRVEPLERGAGFEFVDAVKGGAIPRQFLPAVEKGVRQAMERGGVAGFPMQDLRVTVYDGKSHPVDSKEVAFVVAGRKAFREAAQKARPQLLEPIANIEVAVPDGSMGDVTADLSSRRAQVNGMRAGQDGWTVVSALLPLSELTGYQSRLHSATGGSGSYTLSFSHYDAVPPAMQQKMAAQYSAQAEED